MWLSPFMICKEKNNVHYHLVFFSCQTNLHTLSEQSSSNRNTSLWPYTINIYDLSMHPVKACVANLKYSSNCSEK